MLSQLFKRNAAKVSTLVVASSFLTLAGCSDSDNPVVQEKTFVRAIHAVPDAPPVNIRANTSVVKSDTDYAESTGFFSVKPGTYDLAVDAVLPTTVSEVILVEDVPLAKDARTTIFAVGTVDASDGADRDLAALVVEEPVNEPASTEVSIKVVHAAPVAGPVDIYITAFGASLSGATAIDADFKQSAELPAAVDTAPSYQVRITADGDAHTVLYDSGELDLSPFAGQKLLVAALNSTTQTELAESPVKLVVVTESGSLTELALLDTDTQAGAKVVHLSPDAGTVEVFANGTVELIDFFDYGDVVASEDTYALVDAGDYFFDISANDDDNADSLYTSPTLTLPAGSESTAIALGYAATTPALELLASADENRAYATHARVKVIHGAAAVGNVDIYVTEAGVYNSTNVVAGADALLSNVAFKDDSGYVGVNDGDYDIFVMLAGTTSLAIEALNVPITAGDVLTVIARGPDESVGATLTTAGLVVLSN